MKRKKKGESIALLNCQLNISRASSRSLGRANKRASILVDGPIRELTFPGTVTSHAGFAEFKLVIFRFPVRRCIPSTAGWSLLFPVIVVFQRVTVGAVLEAGALPGIAP